MLSGFPKDLKPNSDAVSGLGVPLGVAFSTAGQREQRGWAFELSVSAYRRDWWYVDRDLGSRTELGEIVSRAARRQSARNLESSQA